MSRGTSTNISLLLAIFFSFVLMIADDRYKRLDGLRNILATITHPVHMVANLLPSVADLLVEQFSSKQTLLTENHRLNQQNLQLQGEMLRFQSLEEENSRLRMQLGATLKVGERVTLAELVSISLTPYKQQVILSKGSASSVYQGQSVINASGIMGQVIQVTPFRSTVLLITDSLHAIPVRVLRSGVLTIALGTGHVDRLELPYLPDTADVRVGDLIVTSGLGERFPPNYPVARITQVPQPGTSRSVIATPLANLSQDRQVMLVWNIESALEQPLPDAAGNEEALPAAEASDETPVSAPLGEQTGSGGPSDG
ncbi:MAG: rod shape-determining protein MreC [Pseudomonadota bacterium]